MNSRFKDKVAIITGATGGIGKAVAGRLGREGASLALFDLDERLLQLALAEFSNEGIPAYGFVVDITNEKQVADAVADVRKRYGKVDIMINSAGIVGPTNVNIVDYPSAEFDKLYHVNLRGAFYITKYVLMDMRQTGKGRLLHISSMAGKEGNPGMVGYSASKAGLIGLVKGVAKEFADTGITINGLAPALIKTPMNENTSAAQLAYMAEKIPMKRLGTVEEVAAVVSFIVSDENSFSTGFIYDISGGRATY
ncbi:MAG TPA: SDR family NAD(P)-dependent oxidoreductase [Puia sp.]|jgi:3-oxoacyl-[acyl-carrier protein] reductase|nr:SDR family NAD(P)-dependent oxidoreductase [Puia sp.]